ncbi:MAG: helix-turn-helix domain-containing protein [Patescibacteria group bacterium]
MKKQKVKSRAISKIAENIKKLKNEHGLKQGSLANKATLAYHTVAKIEAGSTFDPRLSTLQKIADAFEITIDKLVK